MPALTVIVRGDTTDVNSKLSDVERMARRTGQSIATGIGRGAREGAGGLSIISREVIVIGREIMRGNLSRVPGSLSIILQQLGVMKYLFSAVGAAAIAAGAGLFFFFKHLSKVNEEADNSANLFSKAVGHMAESMQRAARDGRVAAQGFQDWLVKLGEAQESLADKTMDTIRAMREEATLRREASGNRSERARLESEQSERQAELRVVEDALNKEKALREKAISDAKAADEAALSGKDAISRRARLDNLKEEIPGSQKRIEELKDALSDVQGQNTEALRHLAASPFSQSDKNRFAANVPNLSRTVSIGGKDVPKSENQLISMLNGNLDAQKQRIKDEEDLSAIQKQLADAYENAKTMAERDNKGVEELQKERDKLTAAIASHSKYDEAILDNAKVSRGHVNSLQQIGAYIPDGGRADKMVKATENNTAATNALTEYLKRHPGPFSWQTGANF